MGSYPKKPPKHITVLLLVFLMVGLFFVCFASLATLAPASRGAMMNKCACPVRWPKRLRWQLPRDLTCVNVLLVFRLRFVIWLKPSRNFYVLSPYALFWGGLYISLITGLIPPSPRTVGQVWWSLVPFASKSFGIAPLSCSTIFLWLWNNSRTSE